jgi:hypothetical protein
VRGVGRTLTSSMQTREGGGVHAPVFPKQSLLAPLTAAQLPVKSSLDASHAALGSEQTLKGASDRTEAGTL